MVFYMLFYRRISISAISNLEFLIIMGFIWVGRVSKIENHVLDLLSLLFQSRYIDLEMFNHNSRNVEEKFLGKRDLWV